MSGAAGELEVVILGCGSSGGVPRGDGDWGDCDPAEPKNHRTRCSLLVRRHGPVGVTSVLIDTSPDLRAQMLAAEVRHVDAVLYTHDHADQVHGIDDLRVFAMRTRRRIPAWMDQATRAALIGEQGDDANDDSVRIAKIRDVVVGGQVKPPNLAG